MIQKGGVLSRRQNCKFTVIMYVKLYKFLFLSFCFFLTSCYDKSGQADFYSSVSEVIEHQNNFTSSHFVDVVQNAYDKTNSSFLIKKELKDITVEVKKIPVELLALRELKCRDSFSKEDLDSVIQTYGDEVYLDVKFYSVQGDFYNLIKKAVPSELLQNELDIKFYEKLNLDSKVLPSFCHFNKTMGVFPGFSFLIGFNETYFETSDSLVVEDCLLTERVSMDISPLQLANKEN